MSFHDGAASGPTPRPLSGPSRGAALACVAGLALGCSAATPEPAPPTAPTRTLASAPWISPARWLVPDPGSIERTDDGIERVVIAGRRMEISGMEVLRAGPDGIDLDGGVRSPSFAPSGSQPYLFWRGRQVYGAARWEDEVRPLATLRGEVRDVFDWLDGEGLLLSTGAVVVSGAGKAAPIGISGVVRALAVDARRGVALTAFGHALITTDGGRSYRDVSAELGGAIALEARGGSIAVTLPGGRERWITASGAIEGRPARPPPGKTPPAEPDALGNPPGRSLVAAVERGLPTGDGGVIVAGDGFVGRLDLATLRVTGAASLGPGLERAECTAFRAADAPLLLCADSERATVIDLTGAPRTERTFDVAADPEADRFAGVDGEAVGLLGPCEGGPARPLGPEIYNDGAPRNRSHQRSAAFCVRAGRDAWVEHRLDPADEPDVIAWIPRVGGGAVALVARPGTLLEDRDRVSVTGSLRVVRVARNEPPLSLPEYGYGPRLVLGRSLRAGADDVIEGWIAHGGGGLSLLSVTIDASGHVHARAIANGAHNVATAGRFALALGEGGGLFETVDGGLRWTAVEGPGSAPPRGAPSVCGPVGCHLGPFLRLGWSGPDHAARRAIGAATVGRRASATPLVRLSCAFAGAPEGRRVAGSAGFGFTPSPQPRVGALVRIGALGFATVPPWSGPGATITGDVELGWIAPLDPAAKLMRSTVTLARLGAATGRTLYDLRVGYLLDEGGRVSTFATGSGDDCPRELLEAAGVARPLGGCVEDPAVGVDVGGRIVALHWGYDGLAVIAGGAPARADCRGAPGFDAGLRELSRVSTFGGLPHGATIGAGVRAGAPMAVLLDTTGEATLAPIDPVRGTFGPEERLRPLTEALPGGAAACAPRPDDARVVLPFEGVIGIDRRSLRGVTEAGGAGVAVLRWSGARACVDAVEVPVRDERYEDSPGPYQAHGSLEKLIARLDGHDGTGTLVLVGTGWELRQKVACTGISPDREDAP